MAGENILYNTADIDADNAIQAWLDSPPHRENMLNPDWREVGIGSVHASTAGGTFGGEPTWVITMDFGTRTGGSTAAAKAPVSLKVVTVHKKVTAKKAAKKTSEKVAQAKLKKAKKHDAVHAKKHAGVHAKKPAAKPKHKAKPVAKQHDKPKAKNQAEGAYARSLGWRAVRATRRPRARSVRCADAAAFGHAPARGRGLPREARSSRPCRPGRSAPAGSRLLERPTPLRARGTASPAGRC